jgi:hypothetical protein
MNWVINSVDQGSECCQRFSFFAGSRGRRQYDLCHTLLPPDLKKKIDWLKCIYDNDLNSLFNFQLDADGFTRLGPCPAPKQEDQLVCPLVRRDTTGGMEFRALYNRYRKRI